MTHNRCLRKQMAQQMFLTLTIETDVLAHTIETDGRQAGATPDRFFCLLWLLYSTHYWRPTGKTWSNATRKTPKRLWTSISGLMGRSSRPPEDPSFTASDVLAMMERWKTSVRQP